MDKRSAHVVVRPSGGWAVRKTGAARASKLFDTEKAAEDYARDLAKRERIELYIHHRDGTIREKDSYSADPTPKHEG